MPIFEPQQFDALNCNSGFELTEAQFIKPEMFNNSNGNMMSTPKHQLLVDTAALSLASSQSSPQQDYFSRSAIEGDYELVSDDTVPIKTEDFTATYNRAEIDSLSISSSESSPINGTFDLSQILVPQTQGLTYYCSNEEDTASEGSQPSPLMQYFDYYVPRTQPSQQPSQQQSPNGLEQAQNLTRFIIYEPASEGGATLIPTINQNPSAGQNALWTDIPQVMVKTTNYPFEYISTPARLPAGTSLTPPSTSTQAPQQTQQSRTHSNTAHGQPTPQQPIKCPHQDCPKTFSRLYNLKAHLRSHSPARPYQCPMCPRSFSRKHDLQRHIRVHTGVKPYQCPCCRKAFARTDALRRHFKMEQTCATSPEVQNMKTRRRYTDMH